MMAGDGLFTAFDDEEKPSMKAYLQPCFKTISSSVTYFWSKKKQPEIQAASCRLLERALQLTRQRLRQLLELLLLQ